MRHRRQHSLPGAVAVVLAICVLCGTSAPASAAPVIGADPVSAETTAPESDGNWLWPSAGPRTVVETFLAPPHAYGPGHRGIDIAVASGEVLRAPADGVVAFRGTVVDRPLLTIDHGGGLVTTFEPVASSLPVGATVAAGDPIGTPAAGGHAPAGTVHVGLRVHGVYVDPMVMFGPVRRAVLLPCCTS